MRRWGLRIGFALVLLLIIGVAGVQGVLWTNLPRQIVIDKIQRELGLRVTAASLSTGWLGHTTLRDVTLSLPLAQEAFVEVPELDVKHSSLPALLFGGSITINSIEIHKPTLIIRQDATGRWNLQDLAVLVARAGGGNTTQANQPQVKQGPPKLPTIEVDDATIIVADNAGRSATVAPLTVNGAPDTALTWKYDARIPGKVDVSGRVAPGEAFKHDVKFDLRELGEWARPWVVNWPNPASARGTWQGQFTQAGVTGQLVLAEVTFATNSAHGTLNITSANGATSIRPAGLVVHARGTDVSLSGGAIVVDGTAAQIQGLRAAVSGGQADVTARYAFADGSASLNAIWQDVSLARGVKANGDVTADLQQPWQGQPKVSVRFNVEGLTAANSPKPDKWEAHATVRGAGRSWGQIDWQMADTRVSFITPRSHFALNDIAATASTRDRDVTLTSLTIGGEHPFVASGAIQLDKHTWWFTADGKNWVVPGSAPGQPPAMVDLDLNIWGSPADVRLNQFYIRNGNFVVFADGDYDPRQPRPVDAYVFVYQIAQKVQTDPFDTQIDSTVGQTQLVRGDIKGEAHVTGTFIPRNLVFDPSTCFLHARDLVVGDRVVGDVDIRMEGAMDEQNFRLWSTNLEILGGKWSLQAEWDRGDDATHVAVAVRGLPLSKVVNLKRRTIEGTTDDGAVAHGLEVSGVADGDWKADVYSLSGDHIIVTGGLTADRVRVGAIQPYGASKEIFAADRVDVAPRTLLKDGQIILDPVMLRRGEGRAQASVSTHIDSLSRLTTSLTMANWPVAPGGTEAAAAVWGETNLEIDTATMRAFGPADFHANVTWRGEPAAAVAMTAELRGRAANVSTLRFDGVGGAALGAASIDVDHLNASRVRVAFTGIRAAELAKLFPALKDVSGTYHGALNVAPASTTEPLDPLEVDLDVHPASGAFRTIEVGDIHLHAFANLERGEPSEGTAGMRFVLDNSDRRPSTIDVAGGIVTTWGRVSRNQGDIPQGMVNVKFNQLSLNQIVHAGDPTVGWVPGLLDGGFTVVGNPDAKNRVFGEGLVNLSEADLGNIGVINVLYNLMHIGSDVQHPTGTGTAHLRLEADTLSLTRLYYFNRGTEIRATGTVADVWTMPQSPVSGTAVGAVRPLKSIQLPILADVDQIMTAVQASTVTVRVTGTAKKAVVNVVPFSDIDEGMRRFLLGDVKSETAGSAG